MAAFDLPLQAPPLPPDTVLEHAEKELTASLHGRPPLAFHLGRSRFVFLADFNGETKFHIREFGTNEITRRKFPTGRGVCLDHVQVRNLMHHVTDMRVHSHHPDTTSEANWHVGKLVFASFSPQYAGNIDFRNYFIPKGTNRLQPTRKGIGLNKREMDNLSLVLLSSLEGSWSALRSYPTPCFLDHAEYNDEERAKSQCDYCSPVMNL